MSTAGRARLLIGAVVAIAATRAGALPAWSDPTLLGHVESVWSRPVVAADKWGRVHVIWGGTRPGGPPQPDGADLKPDALYHTVWDGQSWSEPRPIILKNRRDWHMIYPALAAGADGQLHLGRSSGTALYVSRAPALLAHRAEAWQAPQRLADGGVDKVRVLVSGSSVLVLFTRMGSEALPAWNTFLLRSIDGGDTWSAPVQVTDLDPHAREVAAEPTMALDPRGYLHVAWAVRTPPNWLGRRVQYRRSLDGGQTWLPVDTLAAADDAEPWVDIPTVVATADGIVHMLYACGAPPHRCYRASADGGATWSEPERPFSPLVSLAGWDALIGDEESRLHLFTQQRYPMGMYYATKAPGQPWSKPIAVVADPELEDGHCPYATLASGNQLHAVWQARDRRGDVMHVRITTDAAPRAAPPVPTELAETIPTLTPLGAGGWVQVAAEPLPVLIAATLVAAVIATVAVRLRR